MTNNLLSKRIDNYFEKLSKQNNTAKTGGGIYESFIKPNALMIFLLIVIIIIIICYCYHNANNLDKKVKLQEEETKKVLEGEIETPLETPIQLNVPTDADFFKSLQQQQ